ncbi:Serinc-domain containing serine and sphingolipid biosynthesis protein [Klebsormidium nitens]|uniref:Serinc-domain containing serine and sphingolipid biosynthesis protein n=1 Tax=Klebsormidium nitens TaxID=105231 RepID=A0A1Y1HMN9_KLENI|nr:Serinc-domain containing serine and sphingolipid biosynthesis protein [Klebsormidium nitens]|eukprot:GAQ78459.1 Serinc-domain containing serine and sphingolipid biosynthesis protein [Klebsormidium nitens]
MGSVIGSCAGACAASCICQACAGANRSAARFIYAAIFFITVILAWIIRDYSGDWLKTLHQFKACKDVGIGNPNHCVGSEGVLRLSFSGFIFFAVMFLTTLGTKSKEDCRDSWHSGFWPIKIIFWLGLLIVPFFMPSGFFQVYGEIARFGSGIFLVIQLVTLLNFVYEWNDAWLADDNERRCRIPLVGVSLFCYLLSLALIILMFVWFSPRASCSLNIFFITWTLILILVMTVVSLHPQVNAGLLTSGVMALYMVFLCYSAIMSEPASYSCNTRPRQTGRSDWVSIVSFLLAFIAIIISTFTAGGDYRAFQFKKEASLDADEVPYAYGFFHFVFAMGAMYSAMLFLGWNLNTTSAKWSIDVGWASVWVKIVSEWVTFGLYLWTMLAPLFLKDRSFY